MANCVLANITPIYDLLKKKTTKISFFFITKENGPNERNKDYYSISSIRSNIWSSNDQNGVNLVHVFFSNQLKVVFI